MNFDQLVSKVDWRLVGSAMNEIPLDEHEYETILDMIWSALEKWGLDDLEEFKIRGVEEPFTLFVPSKGDLPVERFLGQLHEQVHSDFDRHRLLVGFVDLQGVRDHKREIIDWKTTRDASLDWVRSLRDSWQWKIYSTAYGAESFRYRGVEKQAHKRVEGRGVHKCREVVLEWPTDAWGDEDVVAYLRQNIDLRESLAKSTVWPARQPWACKQFSKLCPYKDLCVTNSAPRSLIELSPFSYTGIERFSLCEEKYRLEKLLSADDEDKGGDFGKAFHAGIACVYEQMRKL